MKYLNPKGIRFILVFIFFLISLLFGGILFYVAYTDYSESKAFSAKIDEYMEGVHLCRESLNAAVTASENLILTRDRNVAADAELKVRDFRRAVSEFQLLLEKKEPVLHNLLEELSNTAKNVQIAFYSLAATLDEPEPAATFECMESAALLTGALGAASELLQQVNRNVTGDFREWQSRNLYYSQRIQIVIGMFFITALLFLFGVSTVIERMLRKSLLSVAEGTKILRSGQLDFRFKEITPDEIGEVKYDFNMMARRIEKQANELLRANGELRRQAEELIEAHQHKDRFLSNMSHELRTPLNSIIGFSELIQERAEKLSPEKMKSYSGRILTAAEHLLSLIVSLLDLAKSDAGTLKPVLNDFDLSYAINEMVSILRPLADKKSLPLELHIEPEIHVVADQRMMKQIFINLTSNAIKFTDQGRVEIRLYKNIKKNMVFLEVEDTGIGIQEHELKNMFKDFHRVDNGPAHVIDGVGIGLALSRRLATLHGASIKVKSDYGKGSVFTLELPLKTAPIES